MLPQEFKERMRRLLGEEYQAFADSYGRERYQALRLNPLKTDRNTFLDKCSFSLQKVPWAKEGFYYESEDQPGKHPFHEAGVYYIQEPSAMASAEYLDVKPGERVLDLCAAPGGKSTQIAGKMQGQGLLISNEIHPTRAKILSENMERMGICNAIVTNETPQKLADVFIEYFDKIMVDAPCSGEGMFHKNEIACQEWSIDNIKLCANRQDEILDCAAKMLRPGGRMVYSTCTFAPEENEGSMQRFLNRFPEFTVVSSEKTEGMVGGNPAWIEEGTECLTDTIRLFPHKLQGEGHFVAVLQKREDGGRRTYTAGGEAVGVSVEVCKPYLEFAKENLKEIPKGLYLAFGDQLYLAPKETPLLRGLKVLRPGLHLGTNKKNRFEPSHALALYLQKEQVYHYMELAADSKEIMDYLKGQTISAEGEKGWYLILVEGYSIGWGKLVGGVMKNHYPKGLRKK